MKTCRVEKEKDPANTVVMNQMKFGKKWAVYNLFYKIRHISNFFQTNIYTV